MTEYETFAALQANLTFGQTLQTNFYTFISAYLVAGYLAGHRINLSLALFITVGFLVLSAIFMVGWESVYRTNQALMGEMRNAAKVGTGFAWLPSLKSPPMLDADLRHYVLMALSAAGVIGSVYFFFQSRRVNRAAEVSAGQTEA